MIEAETPEFQPSFSVRPATFLDLPSIARLFVDAFPAHPASSLTMALQHKFISAHSQECMTLVAADDSTGRTIGFAIGGRPEQLDRARQAFINGNVFPLAFHALRRRSTYLRLPSRAARSRRGSPGAGYELRYFAVADGKRGRGIGSALLHAVESEMPAGRAYFVWVLADREPTLRFYLRHGFREEYRINGHVRLIKTG